MGTKLNPGKFDAYAKALDNEPMFTLLARDPSAPAIVRNWSFIRLELIATGRLPESDRTMVDEAMHCANMMAKWRSENDGKWRSMPLFENKEALRKSVADLIEKQVFKLRALVTSENLTVPDLIILRDSIESILE